MEPTNSILCVTASGPYGLASYYSIRATLYGKVNIGRFLARISRDICAVRKNTNRDCQYVFIRLDNFPDDLQERIIGHVFTCRDSQKWRNIDCPRIIAVLLYKGSPDQGEYYELVRTRNSDLFPCREYPIDVVKLVTTAHNSVR